MRVRLFSAATVLSAAVSGAAAAATWTVPGSVNASGLNGTLFASDLAVTNPGSAAAVATVALVPANGTLPVTLTLGPGQTVVTRNLLQQLWGASGAGAAVVTSASPLLIRARTYNTAATGTYGVALPVFADDRFLAAGDAGESLWVSQSADGSKGYRTNVAVFFPDAGGGEAAVTVYDAAGNAAGSQTYSLTEPGFQQFAVGGFAGAVAVARAELVVTRGRAAGYAVVVDNVTGDSSLFAFEDLPSGRQDVLVNGVARASGRNGSFFRTDARVYNPSDATATVNVAFHANQGANPSPAAASFTVPSGGLLDVVDVLQAFLGLPVGSAGALRFTSDAPVAILCRTSNVDPTGATPGTYGAQQKPVPLLSFLTSAETGAVVTGIRQGGPFRTNVGFAAGADGANYALTLKNAAGTTVGTASGSLGTWGWSQPNVQDLFPTVTVPDDATLQVVVTAGSVDVFDSSIDNASGDPVVTPVMSLPSGIPSSATIGPAGGSVRSSDGRFTLLVPAGALSAPTPFSVATVANDAPQGAGAGYVLSPANPTFGKPALVHLSYGPADVDGAATAGLGIAIQLPDGWYSLGDGLLDAGRRTLTVALPPGAPSSSARRPAGFPNPFSGHFAIFRAWEIVPKSGVVLGGKTLHFSAVYAGPPSTIPCITPFCYKKITNGTGVDVQWGVGGDAAFGTVSPASGTSTTYTAPCGRIGEIPVFFSIGFAGLPASVHNYPNGRGTATVFARKWQLTIEQSAASLCPAGEQFTWVSRIVDEFSIDEAGGAVSGLTSVAGLHTTNVAGACLKSSGCTWSIDDAWPDVTIQSVSATLGQDGVTFDWNWTKEASRPKSTFACPGGSSTVPMVPGQSVSSGPLVLGAFGSGEKPHEEGGGDNYVRTSILPVAGCN